MGNAEALGPQMLRDQQAMNAAATAEVLARGRVPHLLKSARRAGLLQCDIVEALGSINTRWCLPHSGSPAERDD